jgi:diguanylate cyclase (GGDEF)-like protein/PAS domain S-box-containing protein
MINQELWLGLAINISLLLALFVVYEVSYSISGKKRLVRDMISGLFIAAICLVIMSMPYRLYPGIVFDTRSIIISVTAFSFGPLPATVTSVVALIYRIYTGGSGVYSGIATIITSFSIAMFWRYVIYPRRRRAWLNIYLMSLTVHIVMLADMLLMPADIRFQVIAEIAAPLLLLYPIAGVLLGLLLMHQQQRKRFEQELIESERSKSVLLSHIPGIAYRCAYDDKWTMEFVSEGCYELTGYKPEDLIENRLISFDDLISAEYREILRREWVRVIALKRKFRYEYEIVTAAGEHKWVLELAQAVYNDVNDEQVEALEGIIIDITANKRAHERIQYMDIHDSFTGLYNRKYYESVKRDLDTQQTCPVGIVLVDINGVRIINDAFGHEEGDVLIRRTASILTACCREEDIVSRNGSDDFAVIMPLADEAEVVHLIERIHVVCADVNQELYGEESRLSISAGYGFRLTVEDSMNKAEKDAEESLNKSKLLEQRSHQNVMLSSIMATMYAKSQETEAHSQRIARFARLIAGEIGLGQLQLDELDLLSKLHDVGKVGIDDRILNKPAGLTPEEWAVMRTHPEIGHRILMVSPELRNIAEYVLNHHERWDGRGYPNGRTGESIPLLSRILSIADAYDAMTEDRIYRPALPREHALKEIEKNAGTQFDPQLANLFVEYMRRHPEFCQ